MPDTVTFQASYETMQLKARLQRLVDERDYSIVPYAELSAIAGGNVQTDAKYGGYLRSARKACENETGRLLGAVRGVGVKLLAPGKEQASVSSDHLSRTKRAARRGRDRILKIQLETLSPQDRHSVLVGLTVAGTLAAFLAPSRLRRLQTAVTQHGAALPLSETLALFGSQRRQA